ncbi:DUF523 and DUF1722 domain-containing protein [Bacteriovorax sp. Seq25_V]|uniref:YbgA family protein n=1 Tax=Bacteriovorax sp. Seq25_V TaxID=1201288 RepID=UPI000389FC55|nr:DUF523 and DUF1722 domain-containing protein [Bacteriovorax sp. Seq25_V]EQC43793.1 PF04463 family protein [Bacteriovorax sp. Seq25_V]
MNTKNRPKIVISGCLLGQNIRHDGGHQRDVWITDILSKFVDFHPVCPEMTMGLGTPRETLRVVEGGDGQLKLLENKSGRDLTMEIEESSRKIIAAFPEADGIILAKKSPSCGYRTTKIYDEKSGRQLRKAHGFFAQSVMDSFANFPIIDSGLLHDPLLKELFVRNIYCHFELKKIGVSTAEVQKFHQRFKYMLMEHDPKSVAKLGTIAANSLKSKDVKNDYAIEFMNTIMSSKPTLKKRANVFYHIYGYFKTDLNKDEKDHVLNKIEDYTRGETSYLSLLELFSFLVSSKNKEYLKEQVLLGLYPKELKLLKLID